MMTAKDFLLTTKDNKFNPFTEYDNWKHFDQDYGYNTEAYCARLLGSVFEESEDRVAYQLVRIFEEIININNELGFDVYQVINRNGERFDHVPPHILNETTPTE